MGVWDRLGGTVGDECGVTGTCVLQPTFNYWKYFRISTIEHENKLKVSLVLVECICLPISFTFPLFVSNPLFLVRRRGWGGGLWGGVQYGAMLSSKWNFGGTRGVNESPVWLDGSILELLRTSRVDLATVGASVASFLELLEKEGRLDNLKGEDKPTPFPLDPLFSRMALAAVYNDRMVQIVIRQTVFQKKFVSFQFNKLK